MIDAADIQKDFPLLTRKINGKPIVYLGSTATSLKPKSVINKTNEYYTKYTANIFRGIYVLSEEATREYESARSEVAGFIGARSPSEIVFTRNASESINLITSSWAIPRFRAGDHVVTTIMEHHSNFVPWQQAAQKNGWKMDIWGINDTYGLDLGDLDKLITRRTKLLALTAASNVLGTITPIKKIVEAVKRLNKDCLVLVDAAQAVPHMPVDVSAWGADFVAFSSHKMLGPTGVGVLWAREELLEAMEPYQYGGEMIEEVRVDKTIFKKPPHKFEAGTPDIAGVIGLGEAVRYLKKLGMAQVREHEKEIVTYAMKQLKQVEGLTMYGPTTPETKGGVIAFTLANAHPHDVAQMLDDDNVCIRAGNHCAMPLHTSLSLGATARASFYVYTTKNDIDMMVKSLTRVNRVFS